MGDQTGRIFCPAAVGVPPVQVTSRSETRSAIPPARIPTLAADPVQAIGAVCAQDAPLPSSRASVHHPNLNRAALL